MQTHQLQPKHANQNRKRVGRGGKKGTYSGKGGKGQTARAGRKLAPIIRELIKRYPKLKGYRQFEMTDNAATVDLKMLEKHVAAGDTVDVKYLIDKGLVKTLNNLKPQVKILGKEGLSKKIIVSGIKASAGAKAAIEKVGGSIS